MTTQIDIVWKKRPLIISGPCSAETRDQVLNTAIELKAINKIDVLRAGIWKPRTKPGMFEGAGSQGLEWLKEASKIVGLPVTVEVATSRHVEEALKYQVDIMWIGARTTVNPFAVQELADALRGVDVPVLVKNPINPDLDLWTGAIERFQKAGSEVGMIHRGFSTYSASEFRNPPMWHLPIEMKRRFPSMLLICDPSHISGNRELLQKISQTSIDLDFDGLMIEAHTDPANAWSDARQQVTPAKLAELLDNLIWRCGESADDSHFSLLHKLREQINQIDEELLTLIGQRMKIADQIGLYKKEKNITILQAARWSEILERGLQKAETSGLSKDFIRQYFEAIHLESILHQNNIMNDD